MVTSLVKVPNVLCSFSTFVSLFFTDTGLVRFRGGIAAGSFRTYVATRLEKVKYTCTSFIIMTCCATDLRTKRRFHFESEGFVTPLVLNLDPA